MTVSQETIRCSLAVREAVAVQEGIDFVRVRVLFRALCPFRENRKFFRLSSDKRKAAEVSRAAGGRKICHCGKSSFSFLDHLLQGWQQLIICLHLTSAFSSTSHTPSLHVLSHLYIRKPPLWSFSPDWRGSNLCILQPSVRLGLASDFISKTSNVHHASDELDELCWSCLSSSVPPDCSLSTSSSCFYLSSSVSKPHGITVCLLSLLLTPACGLLK